MTSVFAEFGGQGFDDLRGHPAVTNSSLSLSLCWRKFDSSPLNNLGISLGTVSSQPLERGGASSKPRASRRCFGRFSMFRLGMKSWFYEQERAGVEI